MGKKCVASSTPVQGTFFCRMSWVSGTPITTLLTLTRRRFPNTHGAGSVARPVLAVNSVMESFGSAFTKTLRWIAGSKSQTRHASPCSPPNDVPVR